MQEKKINETTKDLIFITFNLTFKLNFKISYFIEVVKHKGFSKINI